MAGTGTAGDSGDGGSAFDAQLNAPQGVTFDAQGNLYVASSSGRIRRISTDGSITTVVGEGGVGDGGPATLAGFETPSWVTVDGNGNVFVAEFDGHRVRKITPDGLIATVAGTGISGFSGTPAPPRRPSYHV